MYSAVIGIDPGLTGGIAVLRSSHVADVIAIPATDGDVDVSRLVKWIQQKTLYDPYIGGMNVIAYIENVHAMPGQGVSSMFKFGFVTGILHGIIRTLEIPMKLVTPQAWKKQILAGTPKDKQAAIDYCLRVYPNVNLLPTERSKVYHSGMADALCIAEYGYKKENL